MKKFLSILRHQGLALLNWMISYYFVITLIGLFLAVDPAIKTEFLDTHTPFWAQLVQVFVVIFLMWPTWKRLNKWMKVKL